MALTNLITLAPVLVQAGTLDSGNLVIPANPFTTVTLAFNVDSTSLVDSTKTLVITVQRLVSGVFKDEAILTWRGNIKKGGVGSALQPFLQIHDPQGYSGLTIKATAVLNKAMTIGLTATVI